VLEQLKKDHQLHIITNGFSEVQYIKLNNSGILHYFSGIFISEEIGYSKPNPEIFNFALEKCSALAEKSLMVGDDPHTDISGAETAGIKTCFYNPYGSLQQIRSTYTISHLKDLLSITSTGL
jgi:putative hydrolase of the HAD superfamily